MNMKQQCITTIIGYGDVDGFLRGNNQLRVRFFAFLIGAIATLFTRYSSMPQIIKGFKTKKMDDVSFWLIFYLTVGLALWVIYGMLIDDLVIIWANTVGVASNIILLGLKIRYSVNPFE